ncbi:MAG: hypothetical protein OXM54_11750 [Acidimicrobiaceae bacterium]|nr:hypothetical protein [Acidimicrobiaceae bacterium]
MTQASSASSRSAEPALNGQSEHRNGLFGGEDWVDVVTRAMQLAAKRAHLVAYQTGTGVLYRRDDGAVGIFKPDPAMYEDLIPPPFEDERILRYEPAES